jgi:PilZ domain
MTRIRSQLLCAARAVAPPVRVCGRGAGEVAASAGTHQRPSASYLNFASLLCILELLLTALNNRRSRNSLHGRTKKRAACMDEDRRAIRRRVLKGATIEFDRGAHSCGVRNLSELGAALDVPSSVGIPHEFQLVIQANQVTLNCRVIWREENRIGVAFDQAHLPSA